VSGVRYLLLTNFRLGAAINCRIAADFGKLISRAITRAAKPFAKLIDRHFPRSVVRQGLLTISHIRLSHTLNPQALQGFLPLREPRNTILLQQGLRKNQNT
jgi:hypothetical protein